MDEALSYSLKNVNRFLANIDKTLKPFWRRQSVQYKVVLVFSVLLLLATTTYAGIETSKYFSTNSDALIATQQFSKGLQGQAVALPGDHANVLMIPLLYLQGHLPYHYKSFVAGNLLLVLVTILAWAVLLVWLFGRKFEVPTLLLLASLEFTSVTFNLSIGNTTFRNIAYPISLLFILAVSRAMKATRLSRNESVGITVAGLLFGVVLAGDNFFSFAVILPLLIVIAWWWLHSHEFTIAMLRALLLIVCVLLGAVVLKKLLAVTNIIYFDNAFLAAPTVLPSEHLGPSLWIALKQLMQLQGGFVFGQTVDLSNLAFFVNLGLLITGVAGLATILRTSNGNLGRKKLTENQFVFTTIALSYFVILIVYIFSGFAVTQLSNGQVVDYMNARYLAFLPLICVIGILWLLQNRYKAQRYTVVLCVLLLAGIATSYSAVKWTYASENLNKPVPSQTTINRIIGVLEANDVHVIVTDFWYGPPVRFWSSDAIQYAPQIGCNNPLPFDSRSDWFTPQPGERSALLIDRGGLNYGYWGCSDKRLTGMYGQPAQKLVAPGVRPGDTVEIWIYDSDVRAKLLPFSRR